MREKRMYFPMFLDLSKKKIIIIGGGKVAERRVKTLLKFVPEITVIAPNLTDDMKEKVRQGKVIWMQEAFSEDNDVIPEDANIVLAATDDAVCNERIAKLCKSRKIPVNDASDKELCDFYFPAIVTSDETVIGITSGGTDPKKTRQIREDIEQMFIK